MKSGKWIKIVRVSERAVWVPDEEMPKLKDRAWLNHELDRAVRP